MIDRDENLELVRGKGWLKGRNAEKCSPVMFFSGSGTRFYIGKHAIYESAVFNRRGKGKHSRTVGDWRQIQTIVAIH